MNINQQNIVSKAIGMLDKFNMETDELVESVPVFKNLFYELPQTVATKGCLTMKISNDKSDKLQTMVYIPAKGAVKHHFHSIYNEYITVIIGKASYKIYTTDKYSEIKEEGFLEEGQKLVIPAGNTHFIFTSETETYLLVEFKNITK